MSFMFYDLVFLAAFTIFVIVFLYTRRKNLKREGVLFLYKTQIGIKIIDYFGKKHAKFIYYLEYVIIFLGYALMAASLWMIGQVVYIFLRFPDFIKVAKIPPIAPLIPYIGEIFKADYLPPFYFTYWIVALAITAVVHEFFHGILARKNNVRIKSTGFAFLGPFFGAFVEQDDKQMKKLKARNQIAILSAGSFSNLVLTIIFFLILGIFSFAAFAPAGAIFNYYPISVINVSSITLITNESIQLNFNSEDLSLIRVSIGNKSYFLDSKVVKEIENFTIVVGFDDAPAVRAGILGTITEINGVKIGNNQDLKNVLLTFSPGDSVSVKSIISKGNVKESEIVLGERPDNSSQAYLGVASIATGSGIFKGIRDSLSFFREQNTYYAPRCCDELIIFIYNLLWWIVLINLSVALFNMLPVGIFDGGRVFYLTVLRITKSKKIAQKAYSLMAYLFIAVFVLLTLVWAFYTFFK
ncbi:MAG: site-2 protease family protein [Nanoarchaeota archaeon]|nr:site-2 protease family protein [Nanoarchaeota archaeon]MBU4086527.1 site-2 protease family protein [Nanoarchaeota archaeon]